MDKDNLTLRFKDAIWNKVTPQNVIIGGAGGIGSWLAIFISRLGKHNIFIYDFDKIEEHNLGGQLFSQYQVGSLKTAAVIELVDYFTDRSSNIHQYGKYDKNSPTANVVFSCFDNMEARKIMFKKWKENLSKKTKEEQKNYVFIDGRLLAEQYQVYVVTKDRIKDYEKTLFDDSEIPDTGTCSYKQTSHFAAMIASRMTQCFTNFLANMVEEDTYELPFLIEEEGSSFSQEIKD